MSDNRPMLEQGNATPLDEEDISRDDIGFTNPNLHRRIDPHQLEGEYAPRDYNLSINNVNSYRMTENFLRDSNDNTEDEIP